MIDDLPIIQTGEVLYSRGQRWLPESLPEDFGYYGTLGEIVCVGSSDRLFELAALVPAFRAGIANDRGLVWWLLPVNTNVPALEAATSNAEEGR